MTGPSKSLDKKGEAAGSTAATDAINKGIEHMYKIYEKLNSAGDKTTLEGEFRELLQAVKRSDKERRLASQFITRFLEFFPLLYDDAINSMLDLCEDDDVSIRKQVCKDLITVCKKVSTFVPKIADVFSQLMQTDDTTEHKALESCLVSLFHIDAQAALVGVFSQIVNGEEIVRERCFKFLSTKLKDLSPEIVNLEFERCLISEARRSAAELNGEDFKQLHGLLMATKVLQTVSGQQMLVDMIAEMLEMDKDFDASDMENFDKLLMCSKQSLLLFSTQVSSKAYFVYYCTKVLPSLKESIMAEHGGNLKLEALRMMADMGYHVKALDAGQAFSCITPVFSNLVELMPLPPQEDEVNPKFEFSLIECLLYCVHKLGGFCPDFLTSDADRLKDFRLRLQYLARATQAYMKRLREDLQGKRGPELRSDENRSKIQALKLTSNISSVIKDLFHSPPSYKSTIGLSWRPIIRSTSPIKRPAGGPPTSPMSGPKQPRGENRALYQPPSGKFSSRAGAYSSPPRPRGGGFRGRRGGRGLRY